MRLAVILHVRPALRQTEGPWTQGPGPELMLALQGVKLSFGCRCDFGSTPFWKEKEGKFPVRPGLLCRHQPRHQRKQRSVFPMRKQLPKRDRVLGGGWPAGQRPPRSPGGRVGGRLPQKCAYPVARLCPEDV